MRKRTLILNRQKNISPRLDQGKNVSVHYIDTAVIDNIDNDKTRPAKRNIGFAGIIDGIRTQKQKEENERETIRKIVEFIEENCRIVEFNELLIYGYCRRYMNALNGTI